MDKLIDRALNAEKISAAPGQQDKQNQHLKSDHDQSGSEISDSGQNEQVRALFKEKVISRS